MTMLVNFLMQEILLIQTYRCGNKFVQKFNPTHNQAYLQVAQANAQPKTVKKPALSL